MTRRPLRKTLYPNYSIKNIIDELQKTSQEFQGQYNESYDNYKKQTTTTNKVFTNETLRTAVHEYCNSNTKRATIAKYGHIKDWNVTRVTNMSRLFANKRNFNEDISTWDVSNVTTMEYMFHKASSFNVSQNAVWYKS